MIKLKKVQDLNLESQAMLVGGALPTMPEECTVCNCKCYCKGDDCDQTSSETGGKSVFARVERSKL